MPRCHETVLAASQASQPGWENRLTAIFATVLEQHPGLARALFERVGLPPGERYKASIEKWATPVRRVDMEVLAFDDVGVVSRLWSEHKRHGGGFSTGQREDYLAALHETRVPGRLATIVGSLRADDEDSGDSDDDLAAVPGDPSPAEPRWISLTWQLVAELADTVGRGAAEPWGGGDWRKRAVKPEAPARHRALYELVWYLEEEGYAVLEPFQADHAEALARRADTDDTAYSLLERVAEAPEMRPLTPQGEPVDDTSGWCQDLEAPQDSWITRLDGGVVVGMYGHDKWADQPTNLPAVGAGVYFDERWYGRLSECREWLTLIRELGFSFAALEGWVMCYATMPVGELIRDGGETLPEQAHHVAAWSAPLLKRLLSHECDPGPLTAPVKPKGRSRRE
jgi:hypothetical protein